MNRALKRSAKQADIALLLEGTFPYVPGGVSSWVADLLRAFPDLTFAIVFLGGRASDYGAPHYALPDNVVSYQEVFLFDDSSVATPSEAPRCPAHAMQQITGLHDDFRQLGGSCGESIARILPLVFPGGPITEELFLHGEQSWNEVRQRYEKFCTDPSFTDYFWQVRMMHLPIWKLIGIAESLIPVKAFHTACTGYAGFLGAILHFRRGVPLFVSEHGIYTKERQIDLYQSQWIRDKRTFLERDATQVAYSQDLWMRFFRTLGAVAYDAAEVISALFEDNRRRQLVDGADASRTCLIPNGIDVERFRPLRAVRSPNVPQVVALIGRVVPIKDIKTFIRSILIARKSQPDLQGWIVGPENEDPAYVQECRDLIGSLGLQEHVILHGFRDVRDLLPQLGLVVLSSISEGLPLVVLEAYAAAVPVVATRVGACEELINGRDGEDAALGRAGRLVRIADSQALAAAMLELLTDPVAWHEASASAIARVERYYQRDRMVDTIREIYERLMNKPQNREEVAAGAGQRKLAEDSWRA